MGYLIDSLGQKVSLKIARVTEHGAYLVNDEAIAGDEVLLPNNQLDGSLNEGASVDVFLYYPTVVCFVYIFSESRTHCVRPLLCNLSRRCSNNTVQ